MTEYCPRCGKEKHNGACVYDIGKQSLVETALGVYSEVSATEQQMVCGSKYSADGAEEVIFTLPISAKVGDYVEVIGAGRGGWRIETNRDQFIQTPDAMSSRDASFVFGGEGTTIKLVCIRENVMWVIKEATGRYTTG